MCTSDLRFPPGMTARAELVVARFRKLIERVPHEDSTS